jgi:hypothetical protein
VTDKSQEAVSVLSAINASMTNGGSIYAEASTLRPSAESPPRLAPLLTAIGCAIVLWGNTKRSQTFDDRVLIARLVELTI